MTIEFEIQTFGMASEDSDGASYLAERSEDVDNYSVLLRATHVESGEVEVLFDVDDLDFEEAVKLNAELEAMFPEVPAEWLP